MSSAQSDSTQSNLSLDQENWEAERAFRERELSIKERAQKLAEDDLDLKREEHAAARWSSPLMVAIFAAAIAAAGNALVTYLNGRSQVRLESEKAEQSRILEMIKTGSADKAAENLRFLLQAGLITNPNIKTELAAFLKTRRPGTGPVLPVSKDLTDLIAKNETHALKPYRDPIGVRYIGFGHTLTTEDDDSGTLTIGGQKVDFRNGITEQQARQLLEDDLKPFRLEIDRLVSVKLTPNQRNALVSFAFNIGIGNFETSTLLKKLNIGKYEEVPDEMRKWTKAAGREFPGLKMRREAEIALWNKP